ncbi:MAG: O-antigen ligase family protein [Marinomonas sp.]
MTLQEWSLIALILIAGIWGGGGVAYGLSNFLVQFAALIALASGRSAFAAFWQEAPWPAKTLIFAALALPLVQLVPLPPSIWQILPGREMAVEARLMVSAQDDWFPFSLDPGRTLTALLALLGPLAIIALGWGLEKRALIRLAWVIVALGAFSFIIGVPQVLSQGQSGLFYPENPMPGVLFGTFANRNSAGMFLCIALMMLACLPLDLEHKPLLTARITLFALLLFAVLLTRSRSAIVLALIPSAMLGCRLITGFGKKVQVVAGGASLALAALLVVSIPGSRLETSLDRFAQTTDTRAYIWDDAFFSADKYWPMGAGMGTFDEVFQTDQSLENTGIRKAGRAHNDYLELAIEAGPPGLILLAAWSLYIAWLALKARIVTDRQHRWIAWGSSAGLAMIGLQSLLDYPLRNMTMLCVSSLLFLLLLRFSAAEEAQ